MKRFKITNIKAAFGRWGIAVMLSCFALPAQASLYLIDFGSANHTTTGQIQQWNNFTNFSAAASLNLVSTLGVSEGISLKSDGAFILLDELPTAGTFPYAETVVRDSFYNPSARQLTFSGLNTQLEYGLKIYGYANRPDSRLTRITLNGVSKNYEPAAINSGNVSGGNVSFLNLVPDGNGELVFTISSGISNNYILTAAELYTIPEPSVAALLGFAGIVGFSRRRKQS